MKKQNDNMILQYQQYIENIDRNSDRRINCNNFYTTLTSIIISISSIYFSNSKVCIILYLLGIIFSILWLLNLINYKKLSTCKFKVVQEM